MKFFLLAAAGGALGASARYGVGVAGARFTGFGVPFATLSVNVVGGLWLARGAS
jgi:CrcB protein